MTSFEEWLLTVSKRLMQEFRIGLPDPAGRRIGIIGLSRTVSPDGICQALVGLSKEWVGRGGGGRSARADGWSARGGGGTRGGARLAATGLVEVVGEGTELEGEAGPRRAWGRGRR